MRATRMLREMALAEHSERGGLLPADGGACEEVLARFAAAGIDIDALDARFQEEGARSFVKSWNEHGGDRLQERRPDIWKVKPCPVA